MRQSRGNMSEVLEFAHGLSSPAERRKHARKRPNSLTYIELEKDNGGIVLDASASGMSVQAVVSVADDVLPHVRLRLPESKDWLEVHARVVWTRESRKVVGLEFDDLSEQGRHQLQEWLAREVAETETEAAALHEQAAADQRDANDSSLPASSKVAEIRPALALVDYTDQSGAEASDAVPLDAEVQDEVLMVATKDSRPSAGILPTPLSGAQPAARPETEGKQEARAMQKQTAPTVARPQEAHSGAWIYVLLFVLAAGSLTAGWAAGRGKLAPIVAKLQGMLVQRRAAAAMIDAQPERAAGPVSEIEIIDTTGHRRMISLRSSVLTTAVTLPAVQSARAATAPIPKPAMNFQVWTLSAPKHSASSGAAASSAISAPPVVSSTNSPKGPPPIAEITAGDATNAYVIIPKPANDTGVLKRGALLHRVEPEYPELARDQSVSGTVVLNAHIGADGAVRSVSVISGPKLLVGAAENSVRQWRYAPTLLDGKPIETDVQISLVFNLPGESR